MSHPPKTEETSMSWAPNYFDAINAERNGEAAREAERRAMYARPDAPPLPEEAPRRPSRLAALLARAKVRATGPSAGIRWPARG